MENYHELIEKIVRDKLRFYSYFASDACINDITEEIVSDVVCDAIGKVSVDVEMLKQRMVSQIVFETIENILRDENVMSFPFLSLTQKSYLATIIADAINGWAETPVNIK